MRPEAIEAAMTVAPMVGPTARVGAQAAKVAAKELSPVAGDMLMNYMVKQKMILPLDVYHGSPHRFPPTARNPLGEFDASKIGTGEGAQAYGHGIYTAEAPAVATEYANRVKDMASITNMNAELSRLAKVMEADSRGGYRKFKSNVGEEAAQRYDELMTQRNRVSTSPGNLYKADLPDEQIAKMMDLDKPLIKQPYVMNALQSEAEQRVRQRLLVDIENDIRTAMPAPNIGNDYMSLFSDSNIEINKNIQKQALEKLSAMNIKPLVEKELNSMKPIDMNWNMTGKEYYEYLSKTQGSPEQASAMLQKQGVTGNLYLDELSRSTSDKGTRNFVVFPNEEKSIKILERNGETAASPFYRDPFPDTSR
jgi:hypothetical protein